MVLHRASRLYLRQLAPNAVKSKCLSHQLLQTNGFVAPSKSGLITTLPLGQRVVGKLVRIIDDELTAIGCQKMEVPALASEKLWSQSGRWDKMGSEMFTLTNRVDEKYCLQPTAEEMFTLVVKALGGISERMLPLMLYQTSAKFRDEMNPRFGWLRAKQFLMNDLYTFDASSSAAVATYDAVAEAYRKIFVDRLQLGGFLRRVKADAGVMGGDVSHEYHLPNPSAEDVVVECAECSVVAKKDEVIGDNLCNSPDCRCPPPTELTTVEVGHTFQLGEFYSKVFDTVSPSGKPFFMCCFGLGVTRIIAAAIDCLSKSNKAMRLPEALTPFKLAIVLPKGQTPGHLFAASFLHQLDELPNLRDEILVDDRDKSIGRRLNELNQLGIRHVLVASGHKHVDPTATQTLEYYQTHSSDDGIHLTSKLTHSQVFDLVRQL